MATYFIADFFRERPTGWGLRGDPHLWSALEAATQTVPVPDTAAALAVLLQQLFKEMTGEILVQDRNFFVEKYNSGGMSGGVICGDFWLNTAFPLIISRYMKYKKNTAAGE